MDNTDRDNEYLEQLNRLTQRVNDLSEICRRQNDILRHIANKSFRPNTFPTLPSIPSSAYDIETMEAIPMVVDE